jgi:hypothetical protein
MKIIGWLWVLAAFAAYLIQFAPLAQPLIRRFIG